MKVTFVAALAIFLVTSAAAALSKPKPGRKINGPIKFPDCCKEHTLKPVPLTLLKTYRYSSRSCALEAVIFVTVKNRLICADPEAEWTQDRIRHLSRIPPPSPSAIH